MKVGILGGTFDPIHSAHLEMAREAADRYSLDRVLFVPAGNPPHKHTGTPYEHRYRMVELACAADPRFVPSRIEEGVRKSYSIHTIERVKADGGDVFFLIGSDAFAEIQTWHRWEDLVRYAHLAVANRPGSDLDPAAMPDALKHLFQSHQSADMAALRDRLAGHIVSFNMTPCAVSATQIRAALRQGRPITALVSVPVEKYIQQHHLYT